MDSVIGLVAIGSGFTAKNVISFPTEFLSQKVVQDFDTPNGTSGNFKFF